MQHNDATCCGSGTADGCSGTGRACRARGRKATKATKATKNAKMQQCCCCCLQHSGMLVASMLAVTEQVASMLAVFRDAACIHRDAACSNSYGCCSGTTTPKQNKGMFRNSGRLFRNMQSEKLKYTIWIRKNISKIFYT